MNVNLTNEERQALIADCKASIARIEKSITHWMNSTYTRPYLESELARQKIALAALTAEPHHFAVFEPERFGEGSGWKSCHPDFEGAKPFYSIAAPPASIKLPDDVPEMLNLSLEQQTEFNRGFWYGVEKVKRLNGADDSLVSSGERTEC